MCARKLIFRCGHCVDCTLPEEEKQKHQEKFDQNYQEIQLCRRNWKELRRQLNKIRHLLKGVKLQQTRLQQGPNKKVEKTICSDEKQMSSPMYENENTARSYRLKNFQQDFKKMNCQLKEIRLLHPKEERQALLEEKKQELENWQRQLELLEKKQQFYQEKIICQHDMMESIFGESGCLDMISKNYLLRSRQDRINGHELEKWQLELEEKPLPDDVSIWTRDKEAVRKFMEASRKKHVEPVQQLKRFKRDLKNAEHQLKEIQRLLDDDQHQRYRAMLEASRQDWLEWQEDLRAYQHWTEEYQCCFDRLHSTQMVYLTEHSPVLRRHDIPPAEVVPRSRSLMALMRSILQV